MIKDFWFPDLEVGVSALFYSWFKSFAVGCRWCRLLGYWWKLCWVSFGRCLRIFVTRPHGDFFITDSCAYANLIPEMLCEWSLLARYASHGSLKVISLYEHILLLLIFFFYPLIFVDGTEVILYLVVSVLAQLHRGRWLFCSFSVLQRRLVGWPVLLFQDQQVVARCRFLSR